MSSAPWRHYPWLLGLLLAPLLFGSVKPEGQAVVGLLFSLSLLLLVPRLGEHSMPNVPAFWRWAAAALLLLPLLPLPLDLVGFLSPQRAALAHQFPLDASPATAWVPLTLSPAGTLQRLWELALIITVFCLARAAAAQTGFPRAFAGFLGVALLLLAASDVWYRLHGQRSMLGLWEPAWGKGAGTFANRNHFAGWCCVALLAVAGWIIRGWHPLHSARSQALPRNRPLTPSLSPSDGERVAEGRVRSITNGWLPKNDHSRLAAFGLLAIALFGLAMSVASGSRGGLLALLSGAAVWMALLRRRSQSRRRWLGIGLLMLAAIVAGVGAGELVLQRFTLLNSDLDGGLSKIAIWRESFSLFLRFPLLGTGWGSFVTAFTLFKSFGGGATFWHAENEYLQLLVETGLAGFIVFGFVLCRLALRAAQFAWLPASRMPEPELVLGALAGLAAFATHALYEFVFQTPATALLAAALLGFIIGCRDQASRPALLPPLSNARIFLNLAWAIALFAAAAGQGLAVWHWHQARAALKSKATAQAITELDHSLRLWPWAPDRALARTRARVVVWTATSGQAAPAADLRAQLIRALAQSPFDWKLRQELAWLDLAFSTDRDRTRTEMGQAVKLNPLQPQIPLRFARQLVRRDPEMAWELLRSADLSATGNLRQALELAWQLRGDTAALWSLVPDTPDGLLTLGDFAAGRKLLPLAAQAYQRLTPRVEAALLADRFLQINRPDLALAALPQTPRSPRESLLAARAHARNGDYLAAIRLAEAVWRTPAQNPRVMAPAPVTASPATLLDRWKAQPADARIAAELAEAVCQQPAAGRDLALLRELAGKFPARLHLTWLVFQTERDNGQFPQAAETALGLAARALASP